MDDNEYFDLLVHGYAIDVAAGTFIVPEDVLDIILLFVPKGYWMTAGKHIQINEMKDTIIACPHLEWDKGSIVWHQTKKESVGWSTAYSVCQVTAVRKHKFILKMQVIKAREMDDIRIGISSHMNSLDDEFAFSEDGHNYSLIVYGAKVCVGYNGHFEAIATDQDMRYESGDEMTIDLDMKHKVLTFYKNDVLLYRMENIKEADYRMAVSLYGQTASIKSTSFRCIFLENDMTEEMWSELGYGTKSENQQNEIDIDSQNMLIHQAIDRCLKWRQNDEQFWRRETEEKELDQARRMEEQWIERFQRIEQDLEDGYQDRLRSWKFIDGAVGNIRTLIGNLSFVLPAEITNNPKVRWKPIPYSKLLTDWQLKRGYFYFRAIRVVHPDKSSCRGDSLAAQAICDYVFQTLQQAYKTEFN